MKIKELFSGPEKWTKGHNAREADGTETFTHDQSARCWCLWGALIKCYHGLSEETSRISYLLQATIPGGKVSQWNDAPERTFAEVKALVEKLDI